MSRFIQVAAAAVAVVLPTSVFAYDASTTRIETRAFYGATVTLESGVRVFRALPPHSKVIINPGGKTPLSLSFEENRNYNYNNDGNRNGRSDDRSDNGDNGDNGLSYAGGFTDGRGHGNGKPHAKGGHAGPTPHRVSHPIHPHHHTVPPKH